jgi:DNA primase
MTVPPAFLEELRARLPLSEVIGRRLRLVRSGREFAAPCPFHNEKSPSFTVNDQKGFFHCFGCGAHGDVIGFVMRHDHLSFPEAVESLAGLAGLPVPRTAPEDRQRHEHRKGLHEAIEAATCWFEQQLRAPAGAAALAYLRRRGLDDEAIASFRLGYAPSDRNALRPVLERAGFGIEILVEAGLLKRPDDGGAPFSFFRHRVLFPVADRRGQIVAFGGRLIDGEGPKYINTGETPLFHKGQLLYGLSRARAAAAEQQPVVVVEGYMDVIALVRAGYAGAVAPLGTALTETQIEILWRLFPGRDKTPVLCFDGDTAGRRAAARAVDRILPMLAADRSVRVAFLPGGEDPDSLIRGRGVAAFKSVLDQARSLVDVLWEIETAERRFETPEAKAGLKAALDARVDQIADRTVQGFYRGEVGRRINELFWTRWRSDRPMAGARLGAGRPQRPGAPRPMMAPPEPPRRPKSASHRWPRLLLTTLINHPQLLDEFHEILALTEIGEPGLDDLRHALIVLADGVGQGDRSGEATAVRVRLAALGFQELLDELLDPSTYESHRFSAPGADLAMARRGLTDGHATFCRIRIGRELVEAGRRLGQDGGKRDLSRVITLRSELVLPEPEPEDPV